MIRMTKPDSRQSICCCCDKNESYINICFGDIKHATSIICCESCLNQLKIGVDLSLEMIINNKFYFECDVTESESDTDDNESTT